MCQQSCLYRLLLKLKHNNNNIFISRAQPLWYIPGQTSRWVVSNTQAFIWRMLMTLTILQSTVIVLTWKTSVNLQFLFILPSACNRLHRLVQCRSTKGRLVIIKSIFIAKINLPISSQISSSIVHLVLFDKMHLSCRVNFDHLHSAGCEAAFKLWYLNRVANTDNAAARNEKLKLSISDSTGPRRGTTSSPAVKPTEQKLTEPNDQNIQWHV